MRIDDSGDFVAQHYRDFLSREPDQSGLDFWAGDIESCGGDARCREVKRINVSAAFFLSIEFQRTGYFVYKTYKAAFGDPPGKPVPVRREDFMPDTRSISNGVVVGATDWERTLDDNMNAYVQAFVQRGDFQAAFPPSMTAEQFVDKLYSNAGVQPSAGERNAAVAAFGTSRAAALRSVAESQTLHRAVFNKAFVLAQYFGYLKRDPDAAPDADFSGYSFWLSKLDEFNGDFIRAEMVKAFINSTEYRRRFGQ